MAVLLHSYKLQAQKKEGWTILSLLMQPIFAWLFLQQTDIEAHAQNLSVHESTSWFTSWVFFSYVLQDTVNSQIYVY